MFVLKFNANDSRIGHLRYFLPTEKIQDYNVMIDGRNFFDQPIKNDVKNMKTFEKFQLIKEIRGQNTRKFFTRYKFTNLLKSVSHAEGKIFTFSPSRSPKNGFLELKRDAILKMKIIFLKKV